MRKKSQPRKPAVGLTPEEMRVLEHLIERGVLVAVPPKRMGKPRPVISAALIGAGGRILLYLSHEAVALEE